MKRADRGNAIVEVALMAPWIFLLFMAIFDFGFYAYSAISVENAARVAALQTSSAPHSDSSIACFYVRQELQNIANVASLPAGFACDALPLQVTAVDTSVKDGGKDVPASQVTVSYQTDTLFPIPWFPGVYHITRIVSMRQESNAPTT